MDSNLHTPTHRDVIEGALPLEPGEGTLNSLTLRVQCLPRCGVLPYPEAFYQLSVRTVDHDDGFRMVLTTNQLEEFLARISRICQDMAGIELTGREAGFTQYVGSPLCVVDASRADVRCYGKLALAVNEQMQLPAKGVLFDSLSALLDRPASLSVGLGVFAAIAPTLQRGGIQGYPLPKGRERLVVLAYQSAGHVFDQMKVLPFRQLRKESTKGTVVGDLLRRPNATGLRYKGILRKGSSQCLGGRKKEVVLDEERSPQDVGGVSFGATEVDPKIRTGG